MRSSATTTQHQDHPTRHDGHRGASTSIRSVALSAGQGRFGRIMAIFVAGLCLTLFVAVSARADDGFSPRGSLTDPNFPGLEPYAVAVDDSTGDVLVPSGNRVQVYDAGGASALVLSEFGEGELSSARAIAIDQSSHAVYVADPGNNSIDRYVRSSATPPTYTLDKAFKSPAQGAAAGQIGSFASAIAVDPKNGDLLVADAGNKLVSRYKPNGEFLSSFDGSDSTGGAFTNLQGITVDPSGDIYVADLNGEILTPFEFVTGTSRVERFNSAGEAQQEIGGGLLHEARYLAFDARRDDLVVLSGGGQEAPPIVLYVFHGTTLAAQFSDPEAGTYAAPAGLAVDGGASGRLYTVSRVVSIYGVTGVQVFDPAIFPALAPPSGITVHGVHLSGEITPGLEPVTPHFEYSTDQVNWASGPELPAMSEPGPVSQDITGLLGDQRYYVRLVAVAAETTISLVVSFTTAIGSPEVVTLPSAEVSATRASLPGTINANGILTRYHFEYGTTVAYGSRAPASIEDIVGQLRTPSKVNVAVEGLEPSTTYHYRLVATSSAGTSYGDDQVVVTEAAGTPTRAFEQISPVEKGGAQLSEFEGFRVSPDGSSITLGTGGLFDPLPGEGSPANTTYFSERGSEGWSIRSLDIPLAAGAPHLVAIFGASPDMTKVAVLSSRALVPGAVAGKTNVYLEDVRTGELSLAVVLPTYVERSMSLSSFPPIKFFGSHDWSHLYATSLLSLTSESLKESPDVYELSHGTATPLTLESTSGEPVGELGNVSLSPDEKYLTYAGIGDEAKPGKGVFLRQGSEVTAISVSERPGDPSTPQGATSFKWASDGSAVIFQDDDPSGMPLTADAPEVTGNIYRYVLGDEAGHRLQYVGNGELMATDGDTVLYQRGGGTSLFAWREGHTHVVSEALPNPYSEELAHNEVPERLLSPSGRYVEVVTSARLTEDAPTSSRQAYLFDLDDNSLRCVSCNGTPNAGPVGVGFNNALVAPTNEGEVFFGTATSLVSSDANGESDVYAYKAGRLHLISRATPGTYALLASATPDGHDVFIDTNDQLVSQDKDAAGDIYDARVDGGFAAQNPSPRGECSGNACRGVTSTPPPPPLLGSESLVGPGNLSTPVSKPAVKSLTNAQKLAAALKSCRVKRDKGKRASCERQARKRYATKAKTKVKSKAKPKAKRKAKHTAKQSTNGKGSN